MDNMEKGKVVPLLSPENYIIQKARKLPLYECRVSSNWTTSDLLAIFIARKHLTGNLTVGWYLVDLNCLGVKCTVYKFNIYPHEYRELIDNAPIDLDIIPYTEVHNIIYAAIEFAEQYGFKPHPNFGISQYILEEDSDYIEFIDIFCGVDGMPVYVKDEEDTNAMALSIIEQLKRTAGKGNFKVVIDPDDKDVHEDLKKVLSHLEDYDEDIEEYDDWVDEDYDDDWDDDFFPFNYVNLKFDKKKIEGCNTFQFKVQLKGLTNPPVWRRIQVPSYYNFLHLHALIQITFE